MTKEPNNKEKPRLWKEDTIKKKNGLHARNLKGNHFQETTLSVKKETNFYRNKVEVRTFHQRDTHLKTKEYYNFCNKVMKLTIITTTFQN